MNKKRQAKLRHYDKVKAELEQELKANGEWVCFFSGIPIPDHLTWKEVAWHHASGRDGDLLTDKKFLRPVANRYHTGDEGYHNHAVTNKDHPEKSLKNKWWWNGYMDRLKKMDYDLWRRERSKMDE